MGVDSLLHELITVMSPLTISMAPRRITGYHFIPHPFTRSVDQKATKRYKTSPLSLYQMVVKKRCDSSALIRNCLVSRTVANNKTEQYVSNRHGSNKKEKRQFYDILTKQ
jgi:hypothetical protein